MDVLFGLLGFAGFTVGIVWAIIAKIKKQPVKTPISVLCVGVVLFFIAAGTSNTSSTTANNAETTTVDSVLTTVQDTATEATTESTITQLTTETANTLATTKASAKAAVTTTTKAPVKAAATTAKSTTAAKKVSKTVYITPSGKKYHYNGSCNGGKYQASNLDEAKGLGLTPCKKCVK